ncbi:MAG: YbaY family lipoprotein [Saezia sp.]
MSISCIKKIKLLLLLGATLCVTAACVSKAPPSDQKAYLQVEVYYLERMALPENAEITVSLEDVSLADAPAKMLAQETINPQGKQAPFAFTLGYDQNMVKSSHSYSVRATIKAGEQLWFTTTEFTGVKLDGSDSQPVRARVQRVAP